MENQQIIEKILADTKDLMTLKVDNAEVVKDKFKSIAERVEGLNNAVTEPSEAYRNALTIIQTALDTDYKQFSELTDYEQRGQALIQLRHKAAEVCELLQVP